MKFDKELTFLFKYEESNNREKISDRKLEVLIKEYPNVPDDYMDYLKEVGAGTIREIQFNITESLFDFRDIGLDDIYNLPASIKFFGDDYSGVFAGFDFSLGIDEVVEFWSDSCELYYTRQSFRKYIREQMLMGDDGNDLRIN